MWPSFDVSSGVGLLTRGGRVLRRVPITAWDVGSRIELMDEMSIDHHVLSPLPPLVCDRGSLTESWLWTRTLNEGLAEVVRQWPNRFSALGTVPLHQPDQASAELRHAHACGLLGVEIGTSVGPRELDDPQLSEFFATARELDMVIFVHPLILGDMAGWTERIVGHEITFGLGMPVDTAIAAAHLLFGAVSEATAGLRLLLAHGGGAFPWVLPRIARLWDLNHETTAAQRARNVYVDTVVYQSANVRYLVDVLGPERVLFGTDFPLPAQDDLRNATVSGLDADTVEAILGGNAEKLFGLTRS
jgi:aminocarboxymuconate-semialdehyde decarboxylase